MFLSITVVLIIGMLSVIGAYAYNQADLQRLKITNSCPYCDLSGTLMGGWQLNGANLNGADLHNANLTGANFSGAGLTGATWTDGLKCKSGSIGKCKK